MPPRAVPTVALILSALTAALAVWIVVPPPQTLIWLLAVVVGEYSLWVGLVGLIGAGLGGWAWLAGRPGWLAALAVGLGLVTVGLSLWPWWTARAPAGAVGADLSLSTYLFGQRLPDVQVETRTYTISAGQPLSLDLYRTGSSGLKPAVIVVHGGSWTGGNRSDFPSWDRWWAGSVGAVVLDIDYTLTPGDWRRPVEDVKAAIRWARQHRDELGIDPTRIVLLGRSAGGHLALEAAYEAAESGDRTAQVAAVAAIYPPVDLLWGYANPANPHVHDGSSALRRYLGGPPDQAHEAYVAASPLSHLGPHTPPTLLVHGLMDPLVSPHHTVELTAALQARGLPHQTVYLPTGQHGFDYHRDGFAGQVVQAGLRKLIEATGQSD